LTTATKAKAACVTDAPIDEAYHDLMNALAHGIAEVLPGKGFALLMFDLNEPRAGRINYISNGKREDIITAMKEFIAQSEGRKMPAPDSIQ
jgi:hypothetical protein